MQPIVTARSAARQASARARGALHRWRLPRPPAVLTDRRGCRFELQTREEIEAFDRHDGHFEERELDFLANTLRQGVVLDVGANIGAFAATAAAAVGEQGVVHAFEPLAPALARLRRTLELNRLTNVVIHETALSDSEGEAELLTYGPGLEAWASLTRDLIERPDGDLTPVDRIVVPITTVDAFCAANAVGHVALLKIDVEGAEARVLAGAEQTLRQRRVDIVLMELSDHTLARDGVRATDLLRRAADLGYTASTIGDDGEPRPYAADGEVEFENVLLRPA